MLLGLNMVKMEKFTFIFYHKKKINKSKWKTDSEQKPLSIVSFTHPTGGTVWAQELRRTRVVKVMTM